MILTFFAYLMICFGLCLMPHSIQRGAGLEAGVQGLFGLALICIGMLALVNP